MSKKNKENTKTIQNIVKPVQPSILTSLLLSFKSLKQNLLRFIFITLFFCISLIFATTTINLYYSNSTKQYSQFQLDYNNKYISISQKSTLFDQTIKSSFFQIEASNYAKEINDMNDSYQVYKTFNIDFPIHENYDGILPKYLVKSIDNIIIFDKAQEDIPNYNTITQITNTDKWLLQCYITDMVAESLIQCNYYNDGENNIDPDDYENYFKNKPLILPGCNIPIYIEGIIDTDYESFKKLNFNDPNVYASYVDNLSFYNSIFMRKNDYVDSTNENKFVSTNNLAYTYDDFIYRSFGNTEIIENIKCTSFTNKDDMIILKGHEPQKQLNDQSMQQLAVSRGFYEKYFNQPLEDALFESDGICGDGSSYIDPSTSTQAVFSFYGYRRIIANFGCRIVGVIDEDEPVIYFCNPNEGNDYYNYMKLSYSDYDNTYQELGGRLLIKITDNIDLNTTLYQNLLDRKLTIDNLSFVKLQVVGEFIDNNLILFLGLFFALCLFSILMIFNFVVITIKNSTRDIGIYMSLGMNGFKISAIYLFQILLVSFIAFVISIIGSIVFLNLLDFNLSENASELINQYYGVYLEPIDFEIFKLTEKGFIISFLIAFLTPLITICIPLINLSRKKPIDVIKIS
jgi:hypothetical protein